jgi:hypothetical protein
MLPELPLAKQERATVEHGLASMGIAVLGNAGIGKVRLFLPRLVLLSFRGAAADVSFVSVLCV